MPNKCCVPDCNSNLGSGSYIPMFSFPKEDPSRSLWLRKIPGSNLTITKSTRVCIKHFREDFIIRNHEVTRDDGSQLCLPREKLLLKQEAYPSLFPNLPPYLSETIPVKRKDPNLRCSNYLEKENGEQQEHALQDKIHDLKDVLFKIENNKVTEWFTKSTEECIYFFNINIHNDRPKLTKTVILFSSLLVKIIFNDIDIDTKKYKYLLGTELLCDTYSKLENLLNTIYNLKEEDITFVETISKCSAMLNKFNNSNTEESKTNKLKFLIEQLNLLKFKKVNYSSDFLLFSCTFSYTFPSAYRFLREQNIITLPNPTYLKTFQINILGVDINETLKAYLKKKSQHLPNHERLVSLYLDEIYVKPKITYTSGRIVGLADNINNLEAATTIQAFMFKSILGKNKDIVGLFPVKKLDAEFLFGATNKILNLLHDCGYEVVSITTDNNKVNVKLFKKLCNGNIAPYIKNPFNEEKKIFLLYDTVHLLKNIRNNWLNEKTKTLIFPSFSDFCKIKCSEFKEIVELYESEKFLTIKKAPGLTQKVCFPNSIERQNVHFAVQIFNEKTVAAVTADGTKEFLNIVNRWWRVVNVKHPEKGKHLRDIYADPIRSSSHINYQFLQTFVSWLQNWDDLFILDMPKRSHKLSAETHYALSFTTNNLILLSEYLINDLKLKYVLLGNFQTDSLERRFGQYRKLSGCNYNVSVKQIIDSEKKLKVTSLLKLNCDRIHLKQMIVDIKNIKEDDTKKELFVIANIDDILTESSEHDIDRNILETIIFIAGYVAYKVSSICKCNECKKSLLTDRNLDWEVDYSIDLLSYMEDLNRGGLKYPTQFSIHIAETAYKIFTVLTSEKYETMFLKLPKQKAVLQTLILDMLHDFNNNPTQCNCGRSSQLLIEKASSIWANILLNNYSKIKTNSMICKGTRYNRKITTFSN